MMAVTYDACRRLALGDANEFDGGFERRAQALDERPLFHGSGRVAPLGRRARGKRKGIAERFLRRRCDRQTRLQSVGLRVHLVSQRDLAGGFDRLPRHGRVTRLTHEATSRRQPCQHQQRAGRVARSSFGSHGIQVTDRDGTTLLVCRGPLPTTCQRSRRSRRQLEATAGSEKRSALSSSVCSAS